MGTDRTWAYLNEMTPRYSHTRTSAVRPRVFDVAANTRRIRATGKEGRNTKPGTGRGRIPSLRREPVSKPNPFHLRAARAVIGQHTMCVY